MGPELIAPDEFGLDRFRTTESSDCYAFGMVIYETMSGVKPFHKLTDFVVVLKVVKGERPSRGPRFTDRLWEMVKSCWASQPNDRPSVGDVLQYLEEVANLPEQPSGGGYRGDDDDSDPDQVHDGGYSEGTTTLESIGRVLDNLAAGFPGSSSEVIEGR